MAFANFYPTAGEPIWKDSASACAYTHDAERHLGHVVLLGVWHALDATHPDRSGFGMRQLGTFETAAEAKMAVEKSVGQSHRKHLIPAGNALWASNPD